MEVVLPLVFFWTNARKQMRSRRQRLRKKRGPRKFLTRVTLSDFTEAETTHIFRLSKNAIMEVLQQIQHKIKGHTKRSKAIPAETKLLAILHYLASGSFQYCAAAKLGMSQPTFSRIFRKVIDALVSLATKYIKFPRSPMARQRNQDLFFQRAGIPNVIALIDCTHIALIPPASEEHSYRNRKQFHSLNVQVACGPKMEVLDVVAMYPGCSHDSFILGQTRLGQNFSQGKFGDSIMLGDNGYRNMHWLLTPILNPSNGAERRYNKAHRRTRGLIERLFGILKSRFRCLDCTGGAMLYKPELVGKIIVACCVLQNIASHHNVGVELRDDLREHISYQGNYGMESSNAGNIRRNRIVRQYF